MATTTGIWNNTSTGQTTPLSLAAGSKPTSESTGSSSSSSSSAATISSNDFLTLLVTEMQNQDPTSTTDPNEYINQLVNVNSLEQLVSINQTLTDSLGTTTTSGSQSQSSPVGVQSNAVSAVSHPAAQQVAAQHTAGNLGLPAASSAADRVASALTTKR